MLALAVALVAPVTSPALAEDRSSVADMFRARLVEEVVAYGLDPEVVLNTPATFEMPDGDGTTRMVTVTPNELIDMLTRGATVDGTGPAGTPETTAGDLVHTYVNVNYGSSARAYQVSTSSVPATPAVYPPSPASGLVFDVGGPTYNVKGSYLIGAHTAGTYLGSNVDTADPAGPLPVYVPVVTGGAVFDTQIDFAGHAQVFEYESCFWGTCIAFGFMIATGVAVWDTTTVALPIIP